MLFRQFICLFFLPFIVFAQTTQRLVDSASKYRNTNYPKAIRFAQSAYTQAMSERDDTLMAKSASINAYAQYLSGNRDESLNWHLEAVKLFSKIKDTLNLAAEYNELSVLYTKLKKYANANEVSNLAKQLSTSMHDTNQLATSYNNIGLMYYDRGIPDSAIDNFTNAYRLYKRSHNDVGSSYSLDYLASVFADIGKLPKARIYLEESLSLRIKTGDKMGEAITVNNIGELLIKEKKYAQAIAYLRQARENATALKFTDLEAYTYKIEAEAFDKQGDYKNAYAALQKYQITNEKLLNEKQIKAIEDLQTKYETDKKIQENKLLLQQNEVQTLMLSKRNFTIIALIITSMLIAGISYLLYNRYKIQQQKSMQEEVFKQEKLRSEAIMETEENERQRLARELHDGVGPLLSAAKRKTAYAMMDSQAKNEVLELYDESIKEIRQLSHSMMPPYLLNRSLVQALEDLINRIRQTTPLNIKTEWINTEVLEIGKTETLMLYRTVQEILSNIIKHAEATNVNVELVNHDTDLNLIVYDNGKGFDKEMAKKGTGGMGLKNIKSRIEYIGGTLEIDTYPGKGTTYIIDIPIRNAV